MTFAVSLRVRSPAALFRPRHAAGATCPGPPWAALACPGRWPGLFWPGRPRTVHVQYCTRTGQAGPGGQSDAPGAAAQPFAGPGRTGAPAGPRGPRERSARRRCERGPTRRRAGGGRPATTARRRPRWSPRRQQPCRGGVDASMRRSSPSRPVGQPVIRLFHARNGSRLQPPARGGLVPYVRCVKREA